MFITRNEINGSVIEIGENNRGKYTSYLKDDAIKIPEGTSISGSAPKFANKRTAMNIAFDGISFTQIPVTLDAAILSDDYVLQSYGGFFTGAFVGLAAVDATLATRSR